MDIFQKHQARNVDYRARKWTRSYIVIQFTTLDYNRNKQESINHY